MVLKTKECSLDKKGRLYIPLEFRKRIGERVVVSRGRGCLLVQRKEEREEIEKELLKNLPPRGIISRRMKRFLFANSSEEKIDKYGRLTLPPFLRRNLGEKVILVEVGSYLEIWNSKDYLAKSLPIVL